MTKRRSSSKLKLEKEKSRFSRNRLMVTVAVIVSVVVLGYLLSSWFLRAPEDKFSMKATIVDQLGKEFPNPSFVKNATEILETRGFDVTYFNQTIDVNFYNGLAKSNSGIIILRAHSALREDNSTVDLFTSEEYVPYKYQSELDNQLVAPGEFLYEEPPRKLYYAVTSLFIRNLEGRFPRSIVIAMGCGSLRPGLDGKLPRAFLDKGAEAYIGWTDLVTREDTDNETLKLLKLLVTEDKPLSQAISETSSHTYMADHIPITTRLRSYPPEANNLTVSTLINEAKTTTALDVAVNTSESVIPANSQQPKANKTKR